MHMHARVCKCIGGDGGWGVLVCVYLCVFCVHQCLATVQVKVWLTDQLSSGNVSSSVTVEVSTEIRTALETSTAIRQSNLVFVKLMTRLEACILFIFSHLL